MPQDDFRIRRARKNVIELVGRGRTRFAGWQVKLYRMEHPYRCPLGRLIHTLGYLACPGGEARVPLTGELTKDTAQDLAAQVAHVLAV